MTFISLFSGIGGVEVAWTKLGWKCLAVAETDKAACAVLRHKFPTIPNLGDVTKITEQQIKDFGHIDALFAGWPCQDVSVAGQRKGFKNADGTNTRSGLFETAIQIRRWSGARWFVGENVPGLFSVNEGRDFATVVGELAGAKFDVPGNGWRNTGVALGTSGLIEWTTLDAQWFGLAQRRKRVFFVQDTGNWRDRPPVLLERESLQWNHPSSRSPGQGTAPRLAARTRGGGGLGTDAECDGAVIPVNASDQHAVCATITKNYATHHGRQAGNNGGVAENQLIPEVAGPVTQKSQSSSGRSTDGADTLITHALTSNGFDASEDGTGRGHSACAGSDRRDVLQMGQRLWRPGGDESQNLVAAFNIHSQNSGAMTSAGPSEAALPTEVSRALDSAGLTASQGGTAVVGPIKYGMAVRRLTPTECCRLQGFPDHWNKFATDAKGRTYEQADGPRYRQLGNAVAIPCVEWIARRIMQVESIPSPDGQSRRQSPA